MKRKTSKRKTAKWGSIGAPNSAKRKAHMKKIARMASRKTTRKTRRKKR